MKKILIGLMLLALSGCMEEKAPVETKQAGNFNVSLLFEHEGCRIYHFYHNGRSRYYSKCDTSSSVISTTSETNGKSTIDVETETPTGYTFHNYQKGY